MSSVQIRSSNDSMSAMLGFKSRSRDAQIGAVLAADADSLELASQLIKAALRGNSASISRPQRFAALCS